ncbi:MAG: right-handed parallel beta-helix repeat-containing protein [Kiritimatiellae bacterium]|nr:right-handed parallel beta-helix repeat-containing protein [Kiritimatiellia bacterium]MDD5522427.1 right-handed parallel beta-helix repeat-containing protein [Kiritimatiellia bacterium]
MTRYKQFVFSLSVAAAIFLTGCQPMEFYVAPQGNDNWSGKYVKPTGDGKDGPFATLERARNEIRSLKSRGVIKGPVTVFIREGIYSLSQTLKFGPEDSGIAEALVIYRAYGDEKPLLIGGKQITGFAQYKGNIVKTDVGGQGFKNIYFRQLVFDGKRQHLARYPNYDSQNPYGGGWAYADGKYLEMYKDVPGEDRHSFTCKQEDLHEWARPEEVEVFVFARYNWWNNICRIKSIDRSTRLVTLANDASYPIRPGDRYYFRNALEELDAPGEWYLDRQTWALYFWPPSPLEGRSVYAPVVRTILELGRGTQHITFRGLTFECCEGTAITLKDTTNCLITACTIRNVGDYNGSGISINDGRKNGVIGCDIYEVGSHGVAISGGDRKTLAPAENYADNNYIHHMGVFYKQGVGISLSGVGNRASHNLIHDGPRMGIMFSGNNLVIEYNHIRHMNLETSDTGAVYTGGRDWISSRGTMIRYNYFHDMLGYGQEKGQWVSPFFAWGVYLDDNSGGVDVIGNIVARCSRACIHLHNGRDTVVENNIFIDGNLQQIEFSGWTDTHKYWTNHLPSMIKGYEMVCNQLAWSHMRNMNLHPTNAVLPDRTIMAGNRFSRNIMYYSNSSSKYVRAHNLSFDHNSCDSNLIWHAGQPLLTGQKQVGKTISTNLLYNPGFEDGTPGAMPKDWLWQIRPTNTASAVLVEGNPASGKYSLCINAAFVKEKQRDNYPIIVSKDLQLEQGHWYRVAAKLKATKPETRAGLMIQSYIAKVYFWANWPNEVKVGPDWKDYQFTFKVPGPGEKGYNERMKVFRVRLDFPEDSGSLFADDISLTEVEMLDEWTSWQARGMDQHSVVADPLFINVEKEDYRLKSDSPAFKLGFKSIPVKAIGPYKDELRASWPIVEAEGAREKPL